MCSFLSSFLRRYVPIASPRYRGTYAPATLTGLLLFAGTHSLSAQDTRTVAQPVFPPTCIALDADLTIENGEPSSETQFDTGRIQTALDSCTPGTAVELRAEGNNNGFLIAPITIPSGITLVIDGGVTVFASSNPADYQKSGNVEKCGTVGSKGNGCLHLISGQNTTYGSGIMGYGVIDGRGGDKLLINGAPGPYSWWDLGQQRYLTTPYGLQNNPVLVWMTHANNFTLYKVTIKNSPLYHFLWIGAARGLTVWGAKVITPYTAANTDGIDLGTAISNVTVTQSYISNGDDQIAINGGGVGFPASNISITHLHTYSGRGVSIGSSTIGGVSNVLVDYLDQSGNANDTNGNGFRIKSAADRGGLVQNITYENVCQRNEMYPFRFDPFYVGTNSTAAIPTFQNITLSNITVLPNPPQLMTSISRVWLMGYNANHVTAINFNNVNVEGTSELWPTPANVHISLGPGPVAPSALQSIGGTGITYSGSVSATEQTPYPCSGANFFPLVGELYVSTATNNNLDTLTTVGPATFTLNAVLESPTAETPAPTSPITLYDGATPVGTAALGGNGTLATFTLTDVPAGTHYYSAQYPADKNYPVTNFGGVKVVVK
jgi:hypothetical protein